MFTLSEILKATGGGLARPSRGLGRPGSVERSMRGVSIDSRSVVPGQVFVAVKGEHFDGHDFLAEAARKGAACLVTARRGLSGIPAGPDVVVVKDTVRALSAIAHFHRMRFDIPVVAVTGSNGKTTTKDMIACALSAGYRVLKNRGTRNNHIGMPLALLELKASHQAAVFELGSNHPGEVAYLAAVCRPTMAVITNIGPSHLEHFGSLNGVLKEKVSLLKFLRRPAAAILNADDKMLFPLVKRRRAFGYGMSPGADFIASGVKTTRRGVEFLLGRGRKIPCRLKTVGAHNVYNALAAAAVGRILGIDYDRICAKLGGFDFPSGRMSLFKNDVTVFIDDTYNSNPLSFERAVEAFGTITAVGRKVLVMGDMLELGPTSGEFHRLAGTRAAGVCDVLVAVGGLARAAAGAALDAGFAADKVFCCADSAQAAGILRDTLKVTRRDLVLVKGSRGMRMEKVFEFRGHNT